MKRLLSALVALMCSGAALADPYKPRASFVCYQSTAAACEDRTRAPDSVSVERTVMIDGVIAGRGLVAIGEQLVAWSLERSAEPVNVILNSPGGSVVAGSFFINQMEAVRGRGTRIRCFVQNFAASMAFSILLHCDERYALDNSYMLWHPVRVSGGGALTSREASVITKALASLDRWILNDVAAAIANLPPSEVEYHFHAETLHYARELEALDPEFITVKSSFPGLVETIASPRLKRSEVPMMFGFGGYFRPGTIIYLYEGLLQQSGNAQ